MSTIRSFNRNLQYLNQQFKALLINTSTSVKFICIVIIFGYILSYTENAIKLLSVTPGLLLPPSFWLWTSFTYCFLEIYFWEVLVDIVTVGLCGKLIEPLWGQMEMLFFFTIVNLSVSILTTFYYLFIYICTKNIDILFNVHIHGLTGYIAGVSVAVRQIMPDHLIAKTPLGKFTNRNIPLTVLLLSIILWLIGLLDGTHPVMFFFGIVTSWIYLRYFQRHQNGTKGDSSDNFNFSKFFPNILQPFINILIKPFYQFFVKIGLINNKKLILVNNINDNCNRNSININFPGVDPHDMERRRQIALKALNERLSKTTDSSRQNQLPKSFPQSSKHHGHHHHGHHHHHNQQVSINIPAIPLPPPNKQDNLSQTKSTTNLTETTTTKNSQDYNLIDIDTTETVLVQTNAQQIPKKP